MDRPYVIINCAASADGKIALPNRKQIRISSDEDFDRVMRLRERCDAILVGIETILSDDPKLNVKYETDRQPVKVVLDTKLRIPDDAEVFKGDTKVYILTGRNTKRRPKAKNAEIIKCDLDENGLIDLNVALKELKNRGINSLLVEGGGTVIWSFLKRKLFDEFYVYISPLIIGGAGSPTIADGDGVKDEKDIVKLKIDKIERVGDGVLIKYVPVT